MVARYNVGNDIDPEIYEIETGEYVLYSDYAKLEEALRGCHFLWLREHGEPTCRCVGCKMDARIREVLGVA